MPSWLRPPRPWLLILAAALAVLVGNRGFRRLVANAWELGRLKNDLAGLQRDEADLRSRLEKARKSDFTLERAARRELGYRKPGELEYRFPPPRKP